MISILLFAALPMVAPPPLLQDEHPTDHPAAKVVDLDDQFDELVDELDVAMEAWWPEYSAGQEAGLPEEELPAYPIEAFLPRFAEVAGAGHFDAQMWMIANGAYDDSAGRLMWLERLLGEHTNNPDLADFFGSMVWFFQAGDSAVFRILDQFVASTEVAAHAFDARAVKGLILLESGTKAQQAEGLVLLKDLSSVSRAFPMQSKLVSAIFIAENLQIGMTPPNFEAVDVDGEPISLADYRGKVTVLDFWGFW
ncbi:MAG: hypothetical protein ACI9D0_001506 [Bacteroidia bacterium]|jgi:hypothetical protein